METPHEILTKKLHDKQQLNEESKACRRETILQGKSLPDPWAKWKPNLGSSKGQGKASESSRPAASSSFAASSSDSNTAKLTCDLSDLQQQVAQMSLRMYNQDKRMDFFKTTLAGKFNEVMDI